MDRQPNRIKDISFVMKWNVETDGPGLWRYDMRKTMIKNIIRINNKNNYDLEDWFAKHIQMFDANYNEIDFHTDNRGRDWKLLCCDEKDYNKMIGGAMRFVIDLIKTIKDKWHLNFYFNVSIHLVYFTNELEPLRLYETEPVEV